MRSETRDYLPDPAGSNYPFILPKICPHHGPRVPHISLVFRRDVGFRNSLSNLRFDLNVETSRFAVSHIPRKTSMGHPGSVARTDQNGTARVDRRVK